jgi:nitrite reductase (NO-forming)
VLFAVNKSDDSVNTNDDQTSEQITEGGSEIDVDGDTIDDANVVVDTNIDLDANRVTINVDGGNFKFSPNKIEVKKGDTVEIVFKNTEGFHDFVIDEFNAKTSQIQAGKTETVTFVADKTGSFEYYCSVGTHRQMGMKGTLVVTE